MVTTKYELQAVAPNGQKFLAGYVRVPSISGAMRMMRQNGETWARITGDSECQVEGKGRLGWKLHLGGWVISYSGRTKLEALRSPLPFFPEYK